MPAKKYLYVFLLPIILMHILFALAYSHIFYDGKFEIAWFFSTGLYLILILCFVFLPVFFMHTSQIRLDKKGKIIFAFWSAFIFYLCLDLFAKDFYPVVNDYDVDYMSQNLQEGEYQFVYKEAKTRWDTSQALVINLDTQKEEYLGCVLDGVGCMYVDDFKGKSYNVLYYRGVIQDEFGKKHYTQTYLFEMKSVPNKDVQFFINSYKAQQKDAKFYLFYYITIFLYASVFVSTYLIKD